MQVVVSSPVSPDQKQEALRQVLESETLARSEQLRSFLRYVCQLEIDGRGAEINEYRIGVEALGRPSSFSPSEDSSVRSRAYELRQKLARYYDTENRAAELRIEFFKGSYQPRFVQHDLTAEAPAPTSDPVDAPTPRPPLAWRTATVASLLTAALCLALALWLRPPASSIDPVIRQAWGPLLEHDANVVVALGTNLYLIIRPKMPELPRNVPRYPAFSELYPWFRQHRPLKDGEKLEMHPNETIALGEMSGVVSASNLLHEAHASYQILPERAAPLPSLRGRNVILFGVPISSTSASELLGRMAWTVDFDETAKDMVVREVGHPDAPVFAPARNDDRSYKVVYGLLTVLPADGSSPTSPRRLVIISGITGAGSHGAMDYFTSTEDLLDLRDRFRKQGLPAFPHAYQVVVRCAVNDTLLLSARYAAHRVLQP